MSAYPAQSDPTAVSGRRFGAFVIDGIVIAALFWGLFFATAGITLYEKPTTCAQVALAGEKSSSERCSDDLDITINNDHYSAATWKPAAWAIAGGAAFLYLVIVEWIIQAMTGATLGKLIFGIRTVDEDGAAPGLGKQLIRGVLWIVDGLCDGLIAAILILVSKGHRRLGDMAAKTFVVRTGSKGSPIVVPGLEAAAVGAGAAAPVGAYPAPSTPPASPYAPPATGAMGTTAPPPPTASAAPSEPAAPAPSAAAPPTPAPEPSGPQWDAGRNAYIQWDPAGNRWLTYDDAATEWKPLEGEQPPPPA